MDLQTLHDTVRQRLLAVDGMTSKPYVSPTGSGTPKGGIEEFMLQGKYFGGLRLTDKYLMIYLMPLYTIPELNDQYADLLKPVRSGKSCLKVTKPEKLNLSAVEAIITAGVAHQQ